MFDISRFLWLGHKNLCEENIISTCLIVTEINCTAGNWCSYFAVSAKVLLDLILMRFSGIFVFIPCLEKSISLKIDKKIRQPHDTRGCLIFLLWNRAWIRTTNKARSADHPLPPQIYTHVALAKQKEILSAKHPRNKISIS